MNLPAVGVAGAVIVLVTRAFRAKMPGGAAEGAFCATLTTAAVATVASWSADYWKLQSNTLLAFAAMCVAWLAASHARERSGGASRRGVLISFAVLSASIAQGLNLVLMCGESIIEPQSWSLIGSAIAVVLACVLSRPMPAVAAIFGLNGFVSFAWPLCAQRAVAHESQLAIGCLIAAVIIVCIDIVDVLAAWRRRRAVWLRDPSVVFDANRPRVPGGLIHVLIFLSGIAAAAVLPHPLTPISFFLLAIAGFVSFHRRGGIGAVLGAGGTALAFASVGVAWLPGAISAPDALVHPKAVLGVSVASLYFDWLRRFWDQQLLDGKPWTTAGRLIPTVGWGSIGAGYAAIAICVAILFGNRTAIDASPTMTLISGLACVCAALRMLRPPLHRPAEASAACAWPLGLVGAMLAAESAEIWWEGGAFRWIFPALAGFALALRSARTARGGGANAGMLSWWAGASPALAILATAAFGSVRMAAFIAAALLITGLSAWSGLRAGRIAVVEESK